MTHNTEAEIRRTEYPGVKPWQAQLHKVIFEADTRAGKIFDIVLLCSILLSLIAVMLESVRSVRDAHADLLHGIEWGLTLLFTVEYILRLSSLGRPLRYARSFFGIVDLLAIAPTYLAAFVPGAQYFLVVRVLRLLRVFRIFKLGHYLSEADVLMSALRASRRKIEVFLVAVFTLVILFGSLMHAIEGEKNGFTSIPLGCYWAVVTLTTVGYGDISPQTPLGQAFAAIIMIVGYAIIAVPTGIVTAEIAYAGHSKISTQACPQCGIGAHEYGARYCRQCGAKL
jgi:voltage-gated potassium channel